MRLLAAILFLITASASAETYLQINGASLHDKPGYNQFNYGGAVEQSVNNDWSVAGGWYRNSEYRGSTYMPTAVIVFIVAATGILVSVSV